MLSVKDMIDRLLNNSAFQALPKADYRPYVENAVRSGLYKLTQNEEGTVGISVGGKFFQDPKEAAAWRELSKHRRSDVISRPVGDSTMWRSVPQDLGGPRYQRLADDIVSLEQRGTGGVSFQRHSFGIGIDTKVLKDFMYEGGVQHGISVSNDTTITVVKAFRNGKSLNYQEMMGLEETLGHSINGKPGERNLGKLAKRQGTMINAEVAGARFDQKFKAFFWESDEFMAKSMLTKPSKFATTSQGWESTFSGASYLNPNTLDKVADQMKAKLDLERKEFQRAVLAGGMDHMEVNQRASVFKNTEKEINKLRSIVRKGGRLQDFRMSGFDEDALRKAGLSEENIAQFQASTAKGDAPVVAAQHWDEFTEGIHKAAQRSNSRYTMTLEEMRKVDLIGSPSSLASEVGDKTFGITTMKTTHVIPHLRADPQFLAAYGRELYDGGNNFEKFTSYNNRMFQAALQDIKVQQKLPAGYKNSLEELLGIEASHGNLDQVESYIRGLKGDEAIEALHSQQGRARRILNYERMGMNPGTHRGMFNEVASGLSEYMSRASVGAKVDDFYGFVEGGLQAHANASLMIQKISPEDKLLAKPLKPGQIGFSPEQGLIMHHEDFATWGSKAAGGGDWDDLFGTILRYDPESGKMMAALKRSPGALGENAWVEMHERSLEGYAREITRNDVSIPQSRGLRSSLEQKGFYNDKAWSNLTEKERMIRVKMSMQETMPAWTENEKAGIKKYSYHYGKNGTIVEPQLPASMKFLTPDDYHAFLTEKKKKFSYIEDMISEVDIANTFSAEELGAMTDAQKNSWLTHANRTSSENVLGKYSLVREFQDATVRQLEAQAIQVAEGTFRPFRQEPVIDLLVQGVARGYEAIKGGRDALNLGSIETATQAMLEGLATAHVQYGLQFDPGFLEGRMSASVPDLMKHIHALDPDINFEDIALPQNDPHALVGRSRIANKHMQSFRGRFTDEMASTMEMDPAISRTFYGDEAIEDADKMAEAWHSVQRMGEQGRLGLSSFQQKTRLGEELLDTTAPSTVSGHARNEVGRVFGSFFDDSGKLGDLNSRAVQAMGAFMQRHGDVAAGALGSDSLAHASSLVSAKHMAAAPHGTFPKEAMREAGQLAREEFDRSKLRGVDADYLNPGLKSASAKGTAYDLAKDISSGVRGKGPQGVSAGEALGRMWDVPIFRKAAIGGAAIVGASLLYKRARDRSPEDLEGPPLLPGGSFYEDAGSQSSPMPAPLNNNMRQSSSGGGMTYTVNTRSSAGDHDAFKAAAQSITGVSAGGSISNSIGMNRARPDPRQSMRNF